MNELFNRALYAAGAIALTCVLVFDKTFSANLSHAIRDFPDAPMNPWAAGVSAVFAGAAVVALYREWRR